MIIDTSALVAILFAEPEAPRLEAAIRAAAVREIGAPTYVETAAVLRAKRGPGGLVAFDALLETLGIAVVPLTEAGARHARDAYDQYGTGRGAPNLRCSTSDQRYSFPTFSKLRSAFSALHRTVELKVTARTMAGCGVRTSEWLAGKERDGHWVLLVPATPRPERAPR